jgi:hypothetical protein
MRITGIRSYPLTVPIGGLQRTAQGSFGPISILIVVVETDAGISGVGEALARYGPKAYAELVDGLLVPKVVGMDPLAADAVWQRLLRSFSGRSGGMLKPGLSGNTAGRPKGAAHSLHARRATSGTGVDRLPPREGGARFLLSAKPKLERTQTHSLLLPGQRNDVQHLS